MKPKLLVSVESFIAQLLGNFAIFVIQWQLPNLTYRPLMRPKSTSTAVFHSAPRVGFQPSDFDKSHFVLALENWSASSKLARMYELTLRNTPLRHTATSPPSIFQLRLLD